MSLSAQLCCVSDASSIALLLSRSHIESQTSLLIIIFNEMGGCFSTQNGKLVVWCGFALAEHCQVNCFFKNDSITPLLHGVSISRTSDNIVVEVTCILLGGSC